MNYTTHHMTLLKIKFGGKCVMCGYGKTVPEKLEFAHIKPTKLNGEGRGLNRHYNDIKKNPSHYVLVCKRCHRTIDNIN